MKYSKATDYALHTMLYMASATPDRLLGVKDLAEAQKVSTTYLSKILTKLVKAGLVESSSGASGGYRLKRSGELISFLDIVHAIEGAASLFECSMDHNPDCLIQQTMIAAEEKMEEYLRNRNLADLARQVTSA